MSYEEPRGVVSLHFDKLDGIPISNFSSIYNKTQCGMDAWKTKADQVYRNMRNENKRKHMM